jgi:hypothetical protein
MNVPPMLSAAADGQHPVPSSREHASASARSTKRSLPEVGELANTQFITAMLIGPRSPVSGSETRMGTGSTLCPCRSAGSGMPGTCAKPWVCAAGILGL